MVCPPKKTYRFAISPCSWIFFNPSLWFPDVHPVETKNAFPLIFQEKGVLWTIENKNNVGVIGIAKGVPFTYLHNFNYPKK